ncbi:MAG: tRNA-U20-dihydrouridine synthase, partial [Clostridia bacterium]|nr:tRNA-U20-dihydrouridine synthase [Clostridia bacterium]
MNSNIFLNKILPPLFLAPMAGITDISFRQICKKFGADVLITEMISAKGIYYKDKKTTSLLAFDDIEQPIGIQLFGSEPDIMAYAVKVAEELSPAFIDINMGCPMPKIVNNGDGSALMKNIPLAEKIIIAAVNAVSVPISVKFRLGYNKNSINAVEFAKMAEAAGASFLTVHGRTSEQMYSGNAEYNIIQKVKNTLKIPVIGNGDVFNPEAASKIHKETGCDGIMIARGALGNPFIFTQIKQYFNENKYDDFTKKQRLFTAMEQVKAMCCQKEERIAIP